jgi:hypothetical protein
VARSNQLGTSTVTVTVSDGVLSATSSFVLTVEGSNNPPIGVVILSPTGNSVFSAPATIPLTTLAADPNGNIVRVDYFLSNAIIASATSPPFSSVWSNVPPGTYWLRAVATDGGGLSVTSLLRQVVVENTIALIPAGAIWKFYDVTGVDLGTAWRGTNYNDLTWSTGPGSLGFGDPAVTPVDSNPSRITTYFRHQFIVSNASSISNLTILLKRDDGAVVYLNSNEVFRSNMPGGVIANSTLALSAISGAEETAWFTNRIASGSLLRTGTNVVAVEVHQGSTDSSDLGFNLMLLGQATISPVVRPTLDIRQASTNIVFSWLADDSWNLYSTPTLGPGAVWVRIRDGITMTNEEMMSGISPMQSSRYFQLRRP